jgi:hypothetical protein
VDSRNYDTSVTKRDCNVYSITLVHDNGIVDDPVVRTSLSANMNRILERKAESIHTPGSSLRSGNDVSSCLTWVQATNVFKSLT